MARATYDELPYSLVDGFWGMFDKVQKSYYYTATGLIAQNVYLFAASFGLAAWFHNCDKENTAREFKLRPEQHVLFAQTVGYPAE